MKLLKTRITFTNRVGDHADMSHRWLCVLLLLSSMQLFAHEKRSSSNLDSLEVEIPPQLTYKPPLEFPSQAIEAGVEGRVYLKVWVGKDGNPRQTEIDKREPEVAFLFDEVARKFGMKCKYSPANGKDNEPISVWVVIPLKFEIPDFEPPVCTRMDPAGNTGRSNRNGT